MNDTSIKSTTSLFDSTSYTAYTSPTILATDKTLEASSLHFSNVVDQLATKLASNLISSLNISSLVSLDNLTSQMAFNLTTTFRDVFNSDEVFQGLVSLSAANNSDILSNVSVFDFRKNVSSSSMENRDGTVDSVDASDGLKNLHPTAATLISDSTVVKPTNEGDEDDWYDTIILTMASCNILSR